MSGDRPAADRPLRIAQVAPPLEAVPPIAYGGTERIVAELVNELEQAVSHHVQEEESEMLPKARAALDDGRRSDLGNEFQAAKSG